MLISNRKQPTPLIAYRKRCDEHGRGGGGYGRKGDGHGRGSEFFQFFCPIFFVPKSFLKFTPKILAQNFCL